MYNSLFNQPCSCTEKGVKRKADTTTATITASSKSSPALLEPKITKISTREEFLSERALPDSWQPTEPTKITELIEPLEYCNEILIELMSNQHAAYAWPFYKPIDITALDPEEYHSIIKSPMDLGTIKVRGFGIINEVDCSIQVVLDLTCCLATGQTYDRTKKGT